FTLAYTRPKPLMKNRTPMCCLVLVALAAGPGPAQAIPPPIEGILYSTGFEPTDSTPFALGSLQGQGGWFVTEGDATIETDTRAHGLQAVQASQASFRLSVTTNAPVLWVDAFVLDPGSSSPPMIPGDLVSSYVFFSTTLGILALDGDGNGNGNFVQ